MKNIAYIDGQNFMHRVAEVLTEANLISDKQEIFAIDIDYMISALFQGEDFEIRYYGVKKINQRKDYSQEILEKSIKFAQSLRRLRGYLSKTGVKYIPAGGLKVRLTDECKNCGYVDYKFQEKGVDVGLAVDLVADSFSRNIAKQVVISSDIDLIPAIIEAKKRKKVIYLAFEGKKNYSISRESSETRIAYKSLIIDSYARVLKN